MPSDLDALRALLAEEEIREQNAARERQYDRAELYRMRVLALEKAIAMIEGGEHGETKRLHDEMESVNVRAMENISTEKRRRGPPSTASGPVGDAIKHTGWSMVELSKKLGVPVNTVRIWGHRGQVANADILELLRKPPFAPARRGKKH